ncbi:hypothetical protein MRX96_045876 [Rhipicephalus microplus]
MSQRCSRGAASFGRGSHCQTRFKADRLHVEALSGLVCTAAVMPASPPRISAAATPEGRLMVRVRMEEPSFRTRLRRGHDAFISISCLSGRNSRGQAYGGGEDGGAQLPDSSEQRP